MCHQTVEKALKSVITRNCSDDEISPKIHHLLKLADRAGLFDKMTPERQSFVKELNPMNVVFNGFKGDWRKISSRLWNLAYDISWDIEPHLLDVTQDKSGFVKRIFKTGQIIYQA